MASKEQEKHYREIITKAVCGKGRKFTQDTHAITPSHKPSSILGCWIINHEYTAKKKEDAVEVSGSYDINSWYSHSDNTKTEVATERVTYVDKVPLSRRDENALVDDLEIIAKVLQQPNCIDASISPNGNKIIVQAEREIAVDVIGETKVVVRINPNGLPVEYEELDEWDHELEEELADIDPNFLVDEKK